jgi:eukaryotic-like serine/threonine-protein kinase
VVAHISTPPPDLGKLVPQLSDELVDLVMELLEKDPDDRPEDANEVAERVDALLKNPPKPRGGAGRKRMPRVRRRRRYRS